jgi:serine/threonine protein kinase
LVKDPVNRPSADELLEHPFVKKGSRPSAEFLNLINEAIDKIKNGYLKQESDVETGDETNTDEETHEIPTNDGDVTIKISGSLQNVSNQMRNEDYDNTIKPNQCIMNLI